MTYIETKHNRIFEINTDYTGQYYYIFRTKEDYSYNIDMYTLVPSLSCGYGFIIEAIEELEL